MHGYENRSAESTGHCAIERVTWHEGVSEGVGARSLLSQCRYDDPCEPESSSPSKRGRPEHLSGPRRSMRR